MSNNNGQYLVKSTPKTKEAFLNRGCTRHVSDPLYIAPTVEDINSLCEICGWSQKDTAQLVGAKYNEKGSTVVRNWRNGKDRIPFSVWRLLLIYSGIINDGPIDASKILKEGVGLC